MAAGVHAPKEVNACAHPRGEWAFVILAFDAQLPKWRLLRWRPFGEGCVIPRAIFTVSTRCRPCVPYECPLGDETGRLPTRPATSPCNR